MNEKTSRNKDEHTSPPPQYLGGSILAMGLFSFSPLIWQYAATAEVFPMNTFFAALIVYLVLRFSRTQCLYCNLGGIYLRLGSLQPTHHHSIRGTPKLDAGPPSSQVLGARWVYPFVKLSAAFQLACCLPYMPLSANLFPKISQ